jgi:hypothetical protein
MIDVSEDLKAAINSVANQPVDLYEMYLDSGTLYYADQDVIWGGHLYAAKVSSRSAIRRYMSGQFDTVSVTFSNVDTTLAQVILENEIEGRRLIIRKIDRTVSEDSIVLFNGRMERPGHITEMEATIEARQLLGSIDFDAPARLFSVYCPWDFKAFECGYTGEAGACDKSWANCSALHNTARFGGFRFIPHSGTYQYTEVEKKRFLLLFSRKKKKTITATFDAVDDTPYDVPIPVVYGRVQIAGIDIQHEDQGSETKALVAFCGGPIENLYYLRANNSYIYDWHPHQGQIGGTGGQTIDPRFPATGYEYNLLAYAGVTIPSDVKAVDPAPNVTAVVQGRGVPIFGPGGVFDHWGWTDNPVWCVRDFMTLPLSQGGLGVPEDEMDDAVSAETAAYCDEIVVNTTNDQTIFNPVTPPPQNYAYKRFRSTCVDGMDPTEDCPYEDFEPGVNDDTSQEPTPINVKRFTMNVAVAKQEKAVDILFKKLLPAFRGYITVNKDGKHQIRSERPVRTSIVAAASAPGAAELACSNPSQWNPGDLVLASPLSANAEVLTVDQALEDRLRFTAPATKAHLVGDELIQVAMAFDDSNIVGNFEYPLADRQPSTNRVTIKYVDSPAGFEARELRINDYAHQAKVHKVNNEDADGSAIDSYFQAWRIGQWLRAKARDLGRFCSFTADIKATLLEIGDVIAVSAGEVGLQCVPFRAIEIGFEENDEVSIVGQLYSSGIYDDAAPQTTVNVPTIFAPITGDNTLDTQVPPKPVFGVSVGRLGQLAISGIAFETLDNTRTVQAATFTLYFVDELAPPSRSLVASLDISDTAIQADGAIPGSQGDYILVGPEIMQLGAVNGSQAAVTRGVKNSVWSDVGNYRRVLAHLELPTRWKFKWNANGSIGNPANYADLTWNDQVRAYTVGGEPIPNAEGNLSLNATGGRAGKGTTEGAPVDRYAIAEYSVDYAGPARIAASFVRRDQATAGDIRLLVFVNGGGAIQDQIVSNTGAFDVDLGILAKDDKVYVAIGPNGTDAGDAFEFDFTIEQAIYGDGVHQPGELIWPVQKKVVTYNFPKSFFGTPASGEWEKLEPFRSKALVAADLYVTNVWGNSPLTSGNFTNSTIDRRLRCLSGGQIDLVVEGVIGIESNACPPATLPESSSIRDMYAWVEQAPVGSPIECILKVDGEELATLTIAAGSTFSNVVAMDTNPSVDGLVIPAQKKITLDVTGVGSTFPGQRLTATIRL